MRTLRYWLIITGLQFTLLCIAPAQAGAPGGGKRILHLYSYGPHYIVYDSIVAGIKDALGPVRVRFDTEFLDAKRFQSAAFRELLLRTLEIKMRSRPGYSYDGILTTDDAALRFVLKHQHTLFAGLPIVFCGVNNQDLAIAQNNNPWVTGVVEEVSVSGNIGFAQQLQPELKRVFFVTENTITGEAMVERVDALGDVYQGVEIKKIDLRQWSFPEFEAKLKTLNPKYDAVVVLNAARDRNGDSAWTVGGGSKLYLETSAAPIYATAEQTVSRSSMGGFVLSHRQHAATAANMLVRILDGESPADIPVATKNPKIPIVNFLQMERFGFEMKNLPPGTKVLNAPDTYFQKYRTAIIASSIIVLMLIGIILLLVRHNLVRRRHAAALQDSEEKLRTTLDSLIEAVLVVEHNGHVSRANPAAAKLIGYPVDEMIGKPVQDIYAMQPEEPDWSPKVLVRCRQHNEKPGSLVSGINITDSGTRYISESITQIPDPSGKIIRYVIVFRDVTETVRLNEQVQHAMRMESIGHLAGGVAHDFNNVLSGIMGSAELLRRTRSPTEYGELVDMIEGAAMRAANLTRKLLSFSRTAPAIVKPINLHSCVNDAVAILNRSIDKRIHVILDLDPDEIVVKADAVELEHTVLNLGINARDAMPEGGRIHIVTRRLAAMPGETNNTPCVLLSVTDSGNGIPAELRDHIFEPYFTTKAAGSGTGLGLASVYGNVKSMKGEILVHSEEGRGTTIELFLPLSSDVVCADHDQKHIGPEKINADILLVDDEPDLRRVCSRILILAGCQVKTGEDGGEALSLFNAAPNDYDLVILDLILPIRNGLDCYHDIRTRRPELPILLMSGYTAQLSLDAVELDPLADFLTKPFTMDVFLKRVSRLLYLTKRTSESEARVSLN